MLLIILKPNFLPIDQHLNRFYYWKDFSRNSACFFTLVFWLCYYWNFDEFDYEFEFVDSVFHPQHSSNLCYMDLVFAGAEEADSINYY